MWPHLRRTEAPVRPRHRPRLPSLPTLLSRPPARPATVLRGALRAVASTARRGLSWLVPRRKPAMLSLLVVGLALLMASGASTGGATQVSQASVPITPVDAAPIPTPTPSPAPPTATPTPEPPLPQSVPAGWQVYRDYHFALAFPGNWLVYDHAVRDAGGNVVAAAVTFNSRDGTQTVGITEQAGLDAATVRQYCAQPGSNLTYAGLPMRTSRTSGTVRTFVFVADSTSATAADGASGGVVYTLLYSEENTPQQLKWLYDSILATFRPEFSSPACH